ncbi:MAG: STAS/SEC14 domain-containing protein [Chitinophagaceae bacterium]
MIEIIKDMPVHVAAFRASGKVTKQDYENILMPAVDNLAKAHKKINFLLLLETDVGNYSLGAWVDDVLVGLKHFTKWNRIAIVSHQDAIKKITDIFGHLVPGEYKGFKTGDIASAKNWVSESINK